MSAPHSELLAQLNAAIRNLHSRPSRGPIEHAAMKRIYRNVQKACERPSHPLSRVCLEDALELATQLLNSQETAVGGA